MRPSLHLEHAALATLDLDDDLLAQAQAVTGMTEKSVLVHEARRALIERENARRLGHLGSTEPNLYPHTPPPEANVNLAGTSAWTDFPHDESTR